MGIVDAWAASKFNLDVPKYCVTAAATVEMLGGPKEAILIVPDADPDTSETCHPCCGDLWVAPLSCEENLPTLLKSSLASVSDGKGAKNLFVDAVDLVVA